MIDVDGDEWTTYAEAARAVRVRVGTLKVWVHRGKVRTRRAGRTVWVNLGDARHAEALWTRRVGGKV